MQEWVETIQFVTFNKSVGTIVGGYNSENFISKKTSQKNLPTNVVLIIVDRVVK